MPYAYGTRMPAPWYAAGNADITRTVLSYRRELNNYFGSGHLKKINQKFEFCSGHHVRILVYDALQPRFQALQATDGPPRLVGAMASRKPPIAEVNPRAAATNRRQQQSAGPETGLEAPETSSQSSPKPRRNAASPRLCKAAGSWQAHALQQQLRAASQSDRSIAPATPAGDTVVLMSACRDRQTTA